MVAEILAVGTELLMGQIANTNAQYITSRLQEAGVDVYFHSVVGDNTSRLQMMLKQALSRADVVILTGGLGPTKDDLTKETVADLFGAPLVAHKESLESIKTFFSSLGREITLNNLKQADMPEGCQVLKNNNGTAPGCIISGEIGVAVLLPGPPAEMQPMFDEKVMPWLLEKSGYKIFSKYIKVFGIGESKLEDMLLDLIDNQSNPTIAPYVKDGVVTIRVTSKCKDIVDGEAICKPIIEEIVRRTKDSVFSTEDESLPEVVVKLLKKNNLCISVAESCTGGLLAASIIDIPGATEVFDRGFVTYSNQAKIDDLDVIKSDLDEYGAVSEKIALQMANGVMNKSKCDIAISITGIAGPEGGTVEKPVGLVFIGINVKNDAWVIKLNIWGNRERIRKTAVLSALDEVRKYIIGKY